MVCKNCGAKVRKCLKYCKKCGANINTGIVPTAHPIGVTIKKQNKDQCIKILAIAGIVIIIAVISVFIFIKFMATH